MVTSTCPAGTPCVVVDHERCPPPNEPACDEEPTARRPTASQRARCMESTSAWLPALSERFFGELHDGRRALLHLLHREGGVRQHLCAEEARRRDLPLVERDVGTRRGLLLLQ